MICTKVGLFLALKQNMSEMNKKEAALSSEELFARGLSPGRYWGRLSPESRALVLDVLHQHPKLTLAEALSHLWWFGGL
jgi:hypothetical protein